MPTPSRRWQCHESVAGDEESDSLFNSGFRELLTYMMEDPRNITFCIHLNSAQKTWGRHGRPCHQTLRKRYTTLSRVARLPTSGRKAIPRPLLRYARPAKDSVAPRMNARILIVEDEEPLTLLLRYNLEAEGYEVETSARGDEADTRLKESTPDLIVLDWMLPGLSGIELCRRLRARPETRHVADHHADGTRRRKRKGARTCHRRR